VSWWLVGNASELLFKQGVRSKEIGEVRLRSSIAATGSG
jgi:hypothetical protein